MGCSIKAILLNLSNDDQIYARNLKDPAEKDLLYIAGSKDNLDGD